MTRRSARDQQGGFTLVAVMVFMALLMMFGATFINHVMTTEESEVEGLLADSRAYWAMMGHYNYMVSRAANQGLCSAGTKGGDQATNAAGACSAEAFTAGVNDNDSIIGSLRDYLDGTNEIQNGSIDAPGTLTWFYPQNPVTNGEIRNVAGTYPYQFSVTGTVAERFDNNGSAANDGQLRLDLSVTSVGAAPVLRGLGDRVQRLTIGFCVVDLKDVDIGGGAHELQQTGLNATQCLSSKLIPAERVEGESFIQFIQRNYLLP